MYGKKKSAIYAAGFLAKILIVSIIFQYMPTMYILQSIKKLKITLKNAQIHPYNIL